MIDLLNRGGFWLGFILINQSIVWRGPFEMVRKRIFLVLLMAMFVLPAAGFAADDPNDAVFDPNDVDDGGRGLFELSLEEAMDMEVISVTRTRGQKVFDSPAVVYVISLMIVKRIIDRHNGRMWVESSVGEGTTFHVALRSSN